jgi:hypothetical protein
MTYHQWRNILFFVWGVVAGQAITLLMYHLMK